MLKRLLELLVFDWYFHLIMIFAMTGSWSEFGYWVEDFCICIISGDCHVVRWIDLCLKSVFDLQIVHYTEFDHFFSVNVDFTFCVFADDVGREVVKFRIRFGIEISTNDNVFSNFECFDYRRQLFIEVTGCFRILQGGFEGRCICTDNVGYDVIVWFNFLSEIGVKVTFEFGLTIIPVPATPAIDLSLWLEK